ncbi:Extracellular phospholipase A1 precursor [Symmachiella dynata]|uniref:RHS repeat-associated core domain-containing protein n=1 Tax=Symmachiella dynata TaxID=2527995 RepID=UPI0011880155|nr:RHS repeat-associated core domain-containing protein [Symmachiella dynata]QDT48160.1 Extracellular phospholipase A1 precursor [Symmachiella dynata]
MIDQTSFTPGDQQAGSSLTFLYDGHGSTRALLDNTAAFNQHYAYTAHDGAIGFVEAAALTTRLYSGEAFDSRVGLQYLRARWYDPNTGHFNRLDDFAGNIRNPQSLHKYLYTHGDPITGIDPGGREFTLPSMLGVVGGAAMVGSVTASKSANRWKTAESWLDFLFPDANLKVFGRYRGPSEPLLRKSREHARLAEAVYEETRPLAGVDGWEYLVDTNASIVDDFTGFKSGLFHKDGEYVLSFGGTDGPDWNDIINNVSQGVLGISAQYTQAIETAKYVIDTYGKNGENVIFVGHSLGGGLATAASVVHSKTESRFNAAGVNEHTVAGHDLSMATHLVNAWRVRGEPLTTLQDYGGFPAPLGWLLGKIPYVGKSLQIFDKVLNLIGELAPDSNGTTYWLEDYGTPFYGRHSIGDSVIPAMERLYDRLYT